MIPDVAHIRSTENSIANRMYQHIRIAVAKEPKRMVNLDTTEPQITSFHQAVDIKSHSYSCFHSQKLIV